MPTRWSRRNSAVRRAALLIVLAASMIAGLASLALILYRLFGFLLGAGLSGDADRRAQHPDGILVVAIAGGLYHGLALRRDQALAQAAPAPTGMSRQQNEEEPEWESEGGPVLTPGIDLTLRGPDGADLDEVLTTVRANLPKGYRLERD